MELSENKNIRSFTPYFANMHLHSTHSDGQFTPYQLAILAKSLGYGGVVLSDHDVISGVRELIRVAEKTGIESMSGVEFTCRQWGVGFHILGYDFDIDNKELITFVKRLCKYRNDHTRALLEAGLSRGTLKGITWQEVIDKNPENEWFCNDQVCRAMVDKGIIHKEDWEAINKVNFSYNSPYALPIEEASVEEVVEYIKKAGGVAVLAHPKNQYEYVDKLVELGIQGIEVCHPMLDEEDEKMFRRKAEQLKLYKTGGTDHTGPMGGCMGSYAVPAIHGALEDDYMAIKERRYG
jgi:predicted metal-dependent phosphoesterase TrpH